MKNAQTIKIVIFIAFFCVNYSGMAADELPNIILVMADDMGWGDPGYNGNKIIHTPHLDQMSREGIRFNRFYAASLVCSPTRGACLTGRHPSRYGISRANVGHLKKEEFCLAELLQARGYATGHFGKWHLGTLAKDYSGKGQKRNPEKNYNTPGMNGFDEWFSTEFAVATWDPYDPDNTHLKSGQSYDTRALYWHNGENVTEPLKGDDSRIIMDRAIPFIEKSVSSGKPFFAVIWFHAPHAPVVGGPEYRAMYAEHEEDAQHYYACITALDEQVGRLRTKLKELKSERNTMVWFCSDNGPEGAGQVKRFRGSAGLYRGRKRSLYEGGIRVPGLLVWPEKIKQTRSVDMPCVTSDYLPTVLDVLGEPVPVDRPYDGVSLLPMIEGKANERPQPIGFRFGSQAVLSGPRYKLVHNTKTEKRMFYDNGTAPLEKWELYDLVTDPAETTNLASDQPEIAKQMKSQLTQWKKSCRASNQGADYK